MKKISFTICFSFLSFLTFAQLNMSLIAQVEYGQTVNDVWGYKSSGPDSTEYALVGTRNGLSIISLADPENPVEAIYIPGPSSLWRDIKTWEDHVYVSNETGGGILVVDMSQALDTITWHRWTPIIPNFGQLTDAHNLFVDEYGYLYLSGTNLPNSRTLIADVFTDPDNPQFVAVGPPIYAHDIYARDNRMYASEIYGGRMAIYDVTNKGNINLLATQSTPANFTHNIWLSDDSSVAFTTDEVGGAPVAAYDISDLSNITELDQYRPIATLGQGVSPHNVHVWNDWLIISYYDDGGIIVDASRPENLIEVGNFDTFFNFDAGFGAWGAYPFLPSGIVLVTDTGNGLYILDANYVRACFLEGNVTDAATGLAINNATVEIDSEQPNFATSGLSGKYETGQAIPGTFEVTFSAAGYITQLATAILVNGEVTILDVALVPIGQAINFSAAETIGCTPLTVAFTDESLAEASAWTWSFPGGEPATSDEQNPVVVYNEPGTYGVSLEIVDNQSNVFELTQDSLVEVGLSPTVAFTVDVIADSVFFTNTSVDATAYLWNFGDGTTSTEANPFHVYDVSGEYQVILTATNNCTSVNFIQNVSVTITDTEDLGAALSKMVIHPNPFSEQLHLEIKSDSPQNILVKVINAQGQVLETNSVNTTDRLILGQNWPQGIYFLSLIAPDGAVLSQPVRVIKVD